MSTILSDRVIGARHGGGGGGAAGAAAAWQSLRLADAVSIVDPVNLLASAPAEVDVRGSPAIEFVCNSGVNASTFPNHARITWALRDIFGEDLDEIEPADLVDWCVQLMQPFLIDNVRVCAVLQSSDAASPTHAHLVAVGKHVTNGYFPSRAQCPGNGVWSSPTAASTANWLPGAVVGRMIRSSNAAQVFTAPQPRSQGGYNLRVGSLPTPAGVGGVGPFTHVSLRIGSVSTSSTATTVRLACKVFAVRSRSAPGFEPYDLPTPTLKAPGSGDGSYNLGLSGHSYVGGVAAIEDATYDGNSVATGLSGSWTILAQGSAEATWADGVYPVCCFVPYLLAELEALGVTGGTVVRRTTNGTSIRDASTDTDIGQAQHDLAVNGVVSPDAIVLCWGGGDAQDAAEAAAYLPRLREHVRTLRFWHPDAAIVILGEYHTAPGVSPELATINGHKQTVAGEVPGCVYVDLDGISLHTDGIHASGDAAGNGEVAARIAAALDTLTGGA